MDKYGKALKEMKKLSKSNPVEYNLPHVENMVDLSKNIVHNNLDWFILADTQIEVNNFDG